MGPACFRADIGKESHQCFVQLAGDLRSFGREVVGLSSIRAQIKQLDFVLRPRLDQLPPSLADRALGPAADGLVEDQEFTLSRNNGPAVKHAAERAAVHRGGKVIGIPS